MTAIGQRITNQASLEHAVLALRARDLPCIEAMFAAAGPPSLRKREAGLNGLIRIIISQQVSTASANAIYQRYCERFESACASDLSRADDSDLRACGLSSPKIRTLRHLASALENGELDLDALAAGDSDFVRAQLTAVKGIGPWTADVYLLFCLGHPDVWPAGDLALQEGVRLALNLRERPNAARLEKISKRWQPWRAVAARLIWAYYATQRNASAAGKITGKPAKSSRPAKPGTSVKGAARNSPARGSKRGPKKSVAKRAAK